MAVHNHGTEQGAGLACRETRLEDGTLRGACLEAGGRFTFWWNALEAERESDPDDQLEVTAHAAAVQGAYLELIDWLDSNNMAGTYLDPRGGNETGEI